MLQPLPGSQVVLLGITAVILVGGVPMGRALQGYSAASVWMVLAAMMMSRALRECGLARRIALWFVRAIGQTSLGLGYALHLTDLTLATGVPSITARSASIVFPIARSISTLYESEPGATSRRLGTFLMTCSTRRAPASRCSSTAAPPTAARRPGAEFAGVEVTWTSGHRRLAPGIVSSLAVAAAGAADRPPDIRHTRRRETRQAGARLAGPIRAAEAIVLACSSPHRLLGAVVLVTGVARSGRLGRARRALSPAPDLGAPSRRDPHGTSSSGRGLLTWAL